MKNYSAGLTLLDLLISIVILAVLVLTASLSISKWLNAGALAQDIRRTSSTLEALQTLASQSSRDIDVYFTKKQISAQYSDEPDKHIVEIALADSVEFSAASLPEKITIHSRGTLSPKSINIANAKQLCTIFISLRGRVRSECVSK